MIRRQELAKIAELKHLELRNAEKDYLLELILYAVSDFKRFLAFKGGTALYKFYNLNRFSEDLDFDVVGKRADLDAIIKKVIRTFELLGMRGTIFEKEEHGNEVNVRLSVRGPLYEGSKESMTRITINLSRRERPELIEGGMHVPSYPEIPSFELSVLHPKEIAAEKIRCIMTREKARDVYDLWFLLKRGAPIDVSLVNRKCRIYNIKFGREAFIAKLHEKRGMWTRDLKGLVIGSLPEFDAVAKEIEDDYRKWA